MDTFEAVDRRISVRAFKPDPVPEETVREILTAASRAPSGGNLQPWKVYVLAGEDMAALKRAVASPEARADRPEYAVYPESLWDPYRTRRFACGEALYATIGIPREDRAARLGQLAKNGELFGAPVGLFFCIDRRMGPPQWADVGMFMQTVMLLAVARGLDTIAQEYWAAYPNTVGAHLGLPEDYMVFSGMAMGYRDDDHPINTLRTTRDPLDVWCELRGFSA